MVWSRYRTLDDIQAIITDSISEGINLEYKGSNVLINRDINIADGSGLRLSHRTLRALNNTAQLHDPREFDWDGYMIVLGITNDEAYSLFSIFGTIGSPESKRKLYYELSPELRAKFEQSFRVDFD